MIKLCIALALLATITLAPDCEVNKLLSAGGTSITDCKCDLSQNTDELTGQTTKYCQKKWNGSEFVQSIQNVPVGIACDAGKAGGDFTRFTTDCVIGGATTLGTKICSNANVYVAALVSASSCPLIDKCAQYTVIDGATAPCLCADLAGSAQVDLKAVDKYCHGTTVADKPSVCTDTSPSFLHADNVIKNKYTGATCMLSNKKVCTQNLVWKKSDTECPALPAVCTAAQKKKFATVIGGDGCQCETDKFCAGTKFCYDGACNDAAKLCSAMTAEECDGLDKTAATCLDAGCDKATCCEGFKVSSAFTMGVQTAVIVGLMTFM